MTQELQRRCYVERMTPGELAIRNAIQEVEARYTADPRLTDIIVLLRQAQTTLADYVDNLPRQKYPVTIAAPVPVRDLYACAWNLILAVRSLIRGDGELGRVMGKLQTLEGSVERMRPYVDEFNKHEQGYD